MQLFDVYSLFEIEPIKALGSKLFSRDGNIYTDFYGGHAVISIGHGHPYFTAALKDQIDKMIFYSNSVQNNLQQVLAEKLGHLSECDQYELFLCNSGAEANENALKIASFETGRAKVLAFKNAFHGRTSAAVNVTDNDKIKAPINKGIETCFLELNDLDGLKQELSTRQYAAVIIEPIQGIGGLDCASPEFLQAIESYCNQYETFFIADEIQSGYGRTGKFFAFQFSEVTPDIISIAKGMGNGFPIGGILINPGKVRAEKGMLGSTFAGNQLACRAAIAVLEVIDREFLIGNALMAGTYLREQLDHIPEVIQVKGKGLMLGAEFGFPIKALREDLVYRHHIFTGNSRNPNLLRILPPLSITNDDVDHFIGKLKLALSNIKTEDDA